MFQFQRTRILGLFAAIGCLAILPGCGGSGSSKTQTVQGNYDQQQYITAYTAYQQSISGFLSFSSRNKVQALMFPVLTSSNHNFTDFMTNILPHISGVSVSMSWNQIESSNGSDTGSGGYDFSSFDASFAAISDGHSLRRVTSSGKFDCLGGYRGGQQRPHYRGLDSHLCFFSGLGDHGWRSQSSGHGGLRFLHWRQR